MSERIPYLIRDYGLNATRESLMKDLHNRLVPSLAALLFAVVVFTFPSVSIACNGTDVILSDNPSADAYNVYRSKDGVSYFDEEGNLLIDKSAVKISPALAKEIAERFVAEKVRGAPLPLTFRKLEWVHGKLIYQFKSGPLEGFNGQYHLGPVNYIEDHLVLDVDAMTGELRLANGCGAAPGQLLSQFDPGNYDNSLFGKNISLVSNNTNFIARRTGNPVKVDGKIEPNEWKDTGHRYFYLGNYKRHKPSEMHKNDMYYAEVWSQISGENLYFAVKTDTPNWVGIMLKDDPNLGMLGAYSDAKVLYSNGEITDRHFLQREDKTFFLEPDTFDNILSKGSRQNHFYTYEFSIPLRSGDPEDIQFEEGRAYNMLFVAGNTLEHYGIFTLDDAHKNHDHSKNNKEHANVWSSTETTLRIGGPPEKDILGASVAPVFSSFDSGFDAEKSNTHFHYAAPPLKDFDTRALMSYILSIAAVVLGLVGMALMILRFRASPAKGEDNGEDGIDLFKYGWIRKFVTWKHFRTVFIVPTLVIFVAIIALGVMDVQDGRRNIATIYTWTLWWSLIIFSFIILGRLWCMMCPFAFIGDLAQRVVSLNRKLPRWMQNMGIQTLGFIGLTLAFTLIAFQSKPLVTAIVILMILAAAIAFSVIYERRSFCRHLCPIGAVIGLYSAISPVALVARSRARCNAHPKKTCAAACPMLEAPQEKDNNIYCNLCMKCLPACPSSNLTLKLQPMGSDLYATRRRPQSEALASLFLLGVIIVETLAMTSVWEPLKTYIGDLLGTGPGVATYLIVFSGIVVLPTALFYGLCHVLKLWLGSEGHSIRGLLSNFAFVFIPLGISLHLAHNLQHLLIEGPIAMPATLRVLEGAGLNVVSLINWNPLPLSGLRPLFIIQMSILGGGLMLTLLILYRLLRRLEVPLGQLYKMTAAMSVYALVVVLSSIYMLGLPMSGRHIH
jgi:hypothetical protein